MRLKNLLKPTPKKLRRLGDAMAALAGGAAVPAFLSENKTLAVVLFIVGALGKFLSVLFAKEDGGKKYYYDDDDNADDVEYRRNQRF